jgi:cyclase
VALAKRVIPTVLNRGGNLVKGKCYLSDRVIGHSLQASRIFAMRGVDELILLDVSATPEGRAPDFKMVETLSDQCFMPLTVGGGIREMDHVKSLFDAGADKVAICTAAIENPRLVEKAATHYGSQAIVVAIDVKHARAWSNCGTVPTTLDPVTWAKSIERMGAGEILLNSIERDGTMQGYDVPLIRFISAAVSIPVIASGGAGSYEHMAEAIEAGASAVAAGAMFAFTNQTPRGAAQYLSQHGIEVRL